MKNKTSNTLIVILAGGFGTRVKHLLKDLPKPLAIVSGHPFLFWVIKFYYEKGFRNITLACHYNSNFFYDFIKKLSYSDLSINIIVEKEPLGTAGSFLNVFNKYDNFEHYIVHNGDTYLNYKKDIFDKFYNNQNDLQIVVKKMSDCLRYGTLNFDEDKNLLSFNEKKPGEGYINTGIYFINKNILNNIFFGKKLLSFEYDFFPELLIRKFVIKVHISDDDFIDIGTEDSLKSSQNFIDKLLLNDEM